MVRPAGVGYRGLSCDINSIVIPRAEKEERGARSERERERESVGDGR